MAFLEKVNSNGFTYLYLSEYAVRENYASNRITVYRFGRIEDALENMYKWLDDFTKFPEKLKENGFGKDDLNEWIKKVESIVLESRVI